MDSQVFRQDYLVIEESSTVVHLNPRSENSTPLEPKSLKPLSLKETRLQQLCVASRYLTVEQCGAVQASLSPLDASAPRELVIKHLIEAYLPGCLTQIDGAEQATLASSDGNPNYIKSWLDVDQKRYLLVLPANIHALLIDNDGALLAA